VISPHTQYNLSNAKTYFREHLQVRQYYSADSPTVGQWFGVGAEMLGLEGVVSEKDFIALCDNLDPRTGERLTSQSKKTRRRIFYDLTIAPPKSVSIAALIGNDKSIVAAHDEAVKVAMAEFQNFASTRVRGNGRMDDRLTGNIVATTFRHDTSRALDPQLHTHCLLFNATYDQEEKRWKALQNYEILRAQKFIDNAYQHVLTRELRNLGYQIKNNNRGSFEIAGIEQPLVDKFSKRHQAIQKSLDQLLNDKPELAGANENTLREIIAHSERPDKEQLSPSALQDLWQSQLTEKDREQLSARNLFHRTPEPSVKLDLDDSIAWSTEHLFARRSVVFEHDVLRFALEKSRGENFTLDELKEHLQKQPHFLRNLTEDPRLITTEEAFRIESEMIELARDGKWNYRPFAANYSLEETLLADDQKEAVGTLLSSSHFVSLFRGGAGVGKSFALAEVQKALQATGYDTVTLAPQRQQVIDLEKDGMLQANTVSAFLTRQEMPEGAVVLLDEGGQLSAKQMLDLFRIVKRFDGRIICSGDTRQHGAVEASDAMRAIEKFTGIFPVSLNTIRRQDPEKSKDLEEKAFVTEYRKAVKDASEGNITFSFDRLEQAGAIIEAIDEDPAVLLAKNYADRIEGNQSAVAVSQTWDELLRVNEAIRSELRLRKLIDSHDHSVTTLKPVDLTDAQKQDERYHADDTVIVFNRKHQGIEKGDQARFIMTMPDRIVVESKGRVREVTQKKLGHISVYRQQEMPLTSGDKLQLKANGRTEAGENLANGELVTVKSIDSQDRITLTDGRTLSGANRQFVRGYAITSYASQGKTADHVLLSDSAVRAATNRQQWYVSISRGRKSVSIYTRDSNDLRRNITRLGDERHAIDLIYPKLAEQIRIETTPGHRLTSARERSLKASFLAGARKLLHTLRHRLAQSQNQHTQP